MNLVALASGRRHSTRATARPAALVSHSSEINLVPVSPRQPFAVEFLRRIFGGSIVLDRRD